MKSSNEKLKGRVVLITTKPSKSKKRGFIIGSKHEVQKPPKGYLNSQMSVFLKANNGSLIQVPFKYYVLTPKK